MISQIRALGDKYVQTLLNESCLRGEPLDESLLKQMKANSEKMKKEKELKLKALRDKKVYINTNLIAGELALMEKRFESKGNTARNLEYVKKEIKGLEDNLSSGKYLDEQKSDIKNYLSELKNLVKIHGKK